MFGEKKCICELCRWSIKKVKIAKVKECEQDHTVLIIHHNKKGKIKHLSLSNAFTYQVITNDGVSYL